MPAIKKVKENIFVRLKKVIVLLTLLFFCSGNNSQVDSLVQKLKSYKQNRSLVNYLSSLYHLIDARPDYYCSKADSLVQTIWQPPSSIDEKEQYLEVLLIIAYHLLKEGQIPQSIRWYEAALTYEEEQRIADTDWEEFIATPLGNNYTRLGDYEKALLLQQKALKSAEAKQAYDLLPSLCGNYATTLVSMQNYEAAKQAVSQGLQAIHKPGGIIGMLYNLQATIYFETGKLDSASYWNQKTLHFFSTYKEPDADPSWHSMALLLSAKLFTTKHKLVKSKTCLKQAQYLLDHNFPGSRQREKAKLALAMASTFYGLKAMDSALHWYRKTVQFFSTNAQGLFPDHTVTDGLFGIASCFNEQEPDSALFYYERGIANDYYGQQLIHTAPETRNYLYSNETFAGKAILLAYNRYKATGNKKYVLLQLWMAELSKGRKLLYEQQRSRLWSTDSIAVKQQAILKNLQYYYLQLAEANDGEKEKIGTQIKEEEYALNLKEKTFSNLLQMPQFSSFKNWLLTACSQASVVSYYQVNDTLYGIHMAGEEAKSFCFSTNDRIHSIPVFIKTYFKQGIAAYNNNPDAYIKESGQLATIVLPSFKNSKANLIISADGVLHQLPFEALYDIESSHFWGESKSITYSFSLLQYLNKPAESPAVKLEIFGIEGAYKKFSALSFVNEEVQYLRENFRCNYHSAEQTEEAVFLDGLQKNNVLHIATHGVANNDAQQPYLVLKENFYLNQIHYSKVECPLVVLTACETAAGRLENREGTNSLAKTFLAKGVQGVIANRWQANDKAAAKLITLFYEALKKFPDPAMALQKARHNYLQQCTSDAEKNPWLWAGFCYLGVDQQIHIKPRSFIAQYFMLIGICVIMLTIAFLFYQKFARQSK